MYPTIGNPLIMYDFFHSWFYHVIVCDIDIRVLQPLLNLTAKCFHEMRVFTSLWWQPVDSSGFVLETRPVATLHYVLLAFLCDHLIFAKWWQLSATLNFSLTAAKSQYLIGAVQFSIFCSTHTHTHTILPWHFVVGVILLLLMWWCLFIPQL